MRAVAGGLSAAIGAALLPADAAAGVDAWTVLTLPSNAQAAAVAADPVAAATVYVAAGSQVHRSADGGATWTTEDLGALNPGDVPPVLSSVAVDPTDPDNVVAGGDYGRVYRSENGGADWTDDRVEHGGSSQVINAIELGLDLGFDFGGVPPRGALAGTSNGVWFATDFRSGHWEVDASWTVGGSVPSHCREVHAIAVDPQDHDVQYAGNDCGLFKTTTPNYDGEPTAWQRVATVPEDVPVRAIVIDPLQPETLYVATDQGIRKVTGGGGTTTLISYNNLPEQAGRALAIDPMNNSLLYVGLQTQGAFKGKPSGSGRWMPFDAGLGTQGIRGLSLSWPDPRRLYAVTAGGDLYGIVQTYVPAAPMDLAVSYTTPPPAVIALKHDALFSAAASVRNLGPAAAEGIRFVLSFEKGGSLLRRGVSAWGDVTVKTLRTTQGACTVTKSQASCDLGTLAPETSAQITIQVAVRTSLRSNRLTTIAAVSGAAVGDLWSTAEAGSGNNRAAAHTDMK
jgi:photosystem II stability/assembly factor-like uncharacterized protein